MKNFYKKSEFYVSAAGLIVLAAIFVCWLKNNLSIGAPGLIAAFLSVCLFAALCLRFVPLWMDSWRKTSAEEARIGGESQSICPQIFVSLLMVNAVTILVVYLVRLIMGESANFMESLDFWRCTDSAHYLDIARDGYLSQGSVDRLVQLVFLPGYPLAVRLVNLAVGNYLVSGLLVSALSFAGAGCVIYRLLCLDYSHGTALRTIKYFCILPGAFFFTAPMSESLFLLLCAACIYLFRRERPIAACLCGGLAAFTRSTGLALLVPLIMEIVSQAVGWKQSGIIKKSAALVLIPAGFAAYCYINYRVSGDPFKFMEYQSEHWGQHFGWFFNTAAYQTQNAISSFTQSPHNFWGLWLPNLIACFGALMAMLASVKKMRPGYTAWFIAYFIVAIGATWLLSAPRYLISLIPVPLALSIISENPKTGKILTLTCACASILYLLAFINRWQVW